MSRNRILIIIFIILCIFIVVDVSRRVYYFNQYYSNNHIINSEVIQNKDNARYHNYLKRVIKNNWVNPLNTENTLTQIKAIIDRNGNITSYEVVKSSGYAIYDKKAVETLLSTTPFQPFLRNMSEDKRLYNFFFKGSEAGVMWWERVLHPLKNTVSQTQEQTTTPPVNRIKRARIQFNNGELSCAYEIFSKWRPELTRNSNVNVDLRIINKKLEITRIQPQNNSTATLAAINAINSTNCQLETNNQYDINLSFIVENFDRNILDNINRRNIFGPLSQIFNH